MNVPHLQDYLCSQDNEVDASLRDDTDPRCAMVYRDAVWLTVPYSRRGLVSRLLLPVKATRYTSCHLPVISVRRTILSCNENVTTEANPAFYGLYRSSGDGWYLSPFRIPGMSSRGWQVYSVSGG